MIANARLSYTREYSCKAGALPIELRPRVLKRACFIVTFDRITRRNGMARVGSLWFSFEGCLLHLRRAFNKFNSGRVYSYFGVTFRHEE